MTTIYRNYLIARLGDKFVAQSQDDECILVSSNPQRLNTAIDDLWLHLEKGEEPAWFAGSSAIDLDTFGPESTPSSADPPAPAKEPMKVSYLTFGLTALAVSAPTALALDLLQYEKRVDVMFAVGVCATAIAFGRRYALLLSFLALVVNNVCCVEPILTLTVPTLSEMIFLVVNVIASFAIPAILKWRVSQCAASSARRIRDT